MESDIFAPFSLARIGSNRRLFLPPPPGPPLLLRFSNSASLSFVAEVRIPSFPPAFVFFCTCILFLFLCFASPPKLAKLRHLLSGSPHGYHGLPFVSRIFLARAERKLQGRTPRLIAVPLLYKKLPFFFNSIGLFPLRGLNLPRSFCYASAS